MLLSGASRGARPRAIWWHKVPQLQRYNGNQQTGPVASWPSGFRRIKKEKHGGSWERTYSWMVENREGTL